MIIISSRDFRSNQGKYLGMAASGNSVVLKTRSFGSFKIVPVSDDDTLMCQEEFIKRVDEGRRQIEEGKYTAVKSRKELDDFLDKL